MGVDIETYRAAIGIFYTSSHKSLKLPMKVINFNLRFHFYCTLGIFAMLLLGCYLKNDKFTFYKIILLMICMDVHPNPGPNSTSTICTLDIMHLNTRSIRNKINYISNLSDSYQILCFSETHLDDSVDTSSLKLDGFDMPIRRDRTHNGGGVMIYLSSMLSYKRRPDLENQRLEIIWTEVKLKSQILLICCFYRSDFNVSQSVFINEIQPSIEQALDYTPNVILLGDLNIDFINLTNYELHDCLTIYNLSNIIKEPTRILGNSRTLIDPIIVSDGCQILDSGTIDVDHNISDHKATYVSIKTELSFGRPYYRSIWNYKNADFEQLNHKINQFNWDNIINHETTVDEACFNFTETYINLCKSCIPRKKVLIRPTDKPWFTSELRYNIRVRDRLRQKALKSNNTRDKDCYKKQRNKVNNMKKYAKENYMNNYEDMILNKNCGSKTFWQLMGRLVDKQPKTSTLPPLQNSNDVFAFTDDEKATLLNDYFCTISSLDDSNIELPDFNKRTDSSLSSITINTSEIIDVLSSLKLNKASGPDGISHRMLKYTSKTIAVPLCKLFNISLCSKSFPALWKLAHVMPIFKKGDRSVVSNYRPISLVSCVGKAFERVVFKYVYNHLITNSLIYQYQSGFLPGHSTVHHLIELTHQTCLALEKYETNCQIFCDISKAFDRVWHRGLLLKLENYGVNGHMLHWFEDYLNNRRQKVLVNEICSPEKTLSAGVPQGSVLGPLLFLIYINDISDDLTGLARLFADDTSLSYSSTNLQHIEIVLNEDLRKLSEWAKKWQILFNPLKTEVLLISNIFHDDNFELSMDGTILKIVETHKHLGVNLSSTNKWSKHIDIIIESASKQVSFLRKIKYRFSKDTLNTLYCSYIRPLLEYASEVWDGCTQMDANRLEQVQLNAARIVTGLPIFASLNSLYTETGWETLSVRRVNKKLSLMYKIVNHEAPSYLINLMPNRVNEQTPYQLRNNQNFDVPFSRLCSFENSFFPSTLRLWNGLDLETRNSSSLMEFKRKIKTLQEKPTSYVVVGQRTHEISLVRIKHNCSSLNADLNRVNIVPSPFCTCGPNIENAYHYFFNCPLYLIPRNRLIASLPQVDINTELLINGNEFLNPETNRQIRKSVLQFIKETGRFT